VAGDPHDDAPPQPEDGTTRVTGTLRRTVALGPVTRIDVDTATGPLTCLHPADPTAADPTRGLPPSARQPVLVTVRRTRTIRPARDR
jgi:tungstate transport system ATP-binding protein